MDLSTAFAQINWWSVLVATLAAFLIGSLWYSPVLFGKTWQKELKLSDEEIKNANMFRIMGLAFVLNGVAAVVLDMFIGPDAGFAAGAMAGLLIGLAWVATAFGVNYLFARKTFRLYLIDAGYFVLFFPVMGGILGAW